MTREIRILNLGGGVQSTTLYLMGMEPDRWGVRFDCAIFADPQGESARTYAHLDWLRSLGGPTILTDTLGDLGDNLMHGQNGTGGRFVSVPAFTRAPEDESEGKTLRQCTKEYKTSIVERVIRRKILGMKPKERMPKDIIVHHLLGISADEIGRAGRIQKRFAEKKWARVHFPLIELGWSRRGCQEFLRTHVPHDVPRSACVFCPMQSDHEWAAKKRDEPEEFAKAVKIDDALREPGTVCNRGMDKPMFLHRSCVPLKLVDFDGLPPQKLDGFNLYDCSGQCGV